MNAPNSDSIGCRGEGSRGWVDDLDISEKRLDYSNGNRLHLTPCWGNHDLLKALTSGVKSKQKMQRLSVVVCACNTFHHIALCRPQILTRRGRHCEAGCNGRISPALGPAPRFGYPSQKTFLNSPDVPVNFRELAGITPRPRSSKRPS